MQNTIFPAELEFTNRILPAELDVTDRTQFYKQNSILPAEFDFASRIRFLLAETTQYVVLGEVVEVVAMRI